MHAAHASRRYACVPIRKRPGWTKGDGTAEDRLDVIQRDGLPADATFVWDEISDRLMAVYEAGASVSGSGTVNPNAGLVQQYLHGDQGMDDPIDALVAANNVPLPASSKRGSNTDDVWPDCRQ